MIVVIVSVVSYSNLNVHSKQVWEHTLTSGQQWWRITLPVKSGSGVAGTAATESSHYGCGADLAKQRDCV